MKQNLLMTFLILGLSTLTISCGEAQFGSLGQTLEKLENDELSEQEIKDIKASPEQVEDMKEIITEVMDPEVKEPIEEVMSPEVKEPTGEVKNPDKRNSIDRVEMYLCKPDPPITKIVKKELDSCFLRDGSGQYVRDSSGEKVRVRFCGTYDIEVVVENQVNVPKYMICHASKGMQNTGRSLCLPKAEIEAYIQKARADGGTSYMGPCK